jgi:hypothetical protein
MHRETKEKGDWNADNPLATVIAAQVTNRRHFVAGLCTLLAAAGTATAPSLASVRRVPGPVASPLAEPDAGRLVDVGGRWFFLHCRGEGTPTVVFDAGYSADSSSWDAVTPAIAAGPQLASRSSG